MGDSPTTPPATVTEPAAPPQPAPASPAAELPKRGHKKLYLILVAVMVVAAGAAYGYWAYSQSRYYSLVRANETAARSAMDAWEATDVSSSTLNADMDAAFSNQANPDAVKTALDGAQTNFDAVKTHLTGDLPGGLSKWQKQVNDSNSKAKYLWVTSKQRKALSDVSSQYLRIVKTGNDSVGTAQAIQPAMQEVIKFMLAANELSRFTNKYKDQATMAAHLSEMPLASSLSAPGYTYAGESTVKAKFPAVDAAVSAADKTIGDAYLLFKDLADNNIAAAITLAPQLQNESARLEAGGKAVDDLNKTTSTPIDKELISASEALRSAVTGSGDAKLKQTVGLRKFQALELTAALDLYSFDHRNSDSSVTYPAGTNYTTMVSALQSGKYLPSAGSADTFSYASGNSNQTFTIKYTDEITGKQAKTAG